MTAVPFLGRGGFRLYGIARVGAWLPYIPSLTVEKLKIGSFNMLRTFCRLVPLRPFG